MVIVAEELPISEETSSSNMITKVCVVGQNNAAEQELINALRTLDVEVVFSESGRDFAEAACMSDTCEVVFLCEPFEGEDFEYLWREDHRIVGPPVIYSCAEAHHPLPCSSRPLYCSAMANIVVCFTGFKEKSKLSQLCALVHFMGGSVRRDFNCRSTHLVANSVRGDKYRAAVGMGTCIMTEEWIHKCWDMRANLSWRADNAEMMEYKLPPFFDCCLTFVGFSEEEKAHMEETTIEQGIVAVLFYIILTRHHSESNEFSVCFLNFFSIFNAKFLTVEKRLLEIHVGYRILANSYKIARKNCYLKCL